jgi:hypothetical protein
MKPVDQFFVYKLLLPPAPSHGSFSLYFPPQLSFETSAHHCYEKLLVFVVIDTTAVHFHLSEILFQGSKVASALSIQLDNSAKGSPCVIEIRLLWKNCCRCST